MISRAEDRHDRSPTPAVGVIVAAGGSGRRMGGVRKQYLELAGEPMLLRALRPFLALDSVCRVVVALPPVDAADPPAWLVGVDPRIQIVAGGAERTDSVRAALAALPDECAIVVVHDAARPLVTPEIIRRTLDAVAGGVSAIAAVPLSDTIKRVGAESRITGTPDRAGLWRAQTPQGFPREVLERAHARAAGAGIVATDDAALVEALGLPVVVVEGSVENLKVTSPLDLALAELILAERAS